MRRCSIGTLASYSPIVLIHITINRECNMHMLTNIEHGCDFKIIQFSNAQFFGSIHIQRKPADHGVVVVVRPHAISTVRYRSKDLSML